MSVHLRGAGRLCVLVMMALGAAAGCELVDPGEEVDGEWLFSARNLTGPGIVCQVDGMTLFLAQDGTRFSGTATDGELACVQDGQSVDVSLGTLPVINGRLTGSRVSFDIGSTDWSVDGTITGRSMDGSMDMVVGAPVGNVVVSGQFGAARVDSLQTNE